MAQALRYGAEHQGAGEGEHIGAQCGHDQCGTTGAAKKDQKLARNSVAFKMTPTFN
ncbi:MAG TPA: hypothetical protein VF306_11775 [Pirellulales bacterium]